MDARPTYKEYAHGWARSRRLRNCRTRAQKNCVLSGDPLEYPTTIPFFSSDGYTRAMSGTNNRRAIIRGVCHLQVILGPRKTPIPNPLVMIMVPSCHPLESVAIRCVHVLCTCACAASMCGQRKCSPNTYLPRLFVLVIR